MNNYICFDIGNVLVEVHLEKFINELKNYTNLSDRAFHQPMMFLEHLQTYQEIGMTNLSKSLKVEYDFHPKIIDALLKTWNLVIEPNKMMLDMLDRLKEAGIKIALLSNMGEEHAEWLAEFCPRLFKDNILWLSYQVGARKPSKLFFQSFLIDHPEFKGASYVDDRKENLIVGKKYGFRDIHWDLDRQLQFKDPEPSILHLEKCIKENNEVEFAMDYLP